MVECHDSNYESSHHSTDSVKVQNSSLSNVGSARVQVNLLVEPVFYGWTRALRIINYLLAIPKKMKHRTHLILDENCQICETMGTRWEIRTNELDAEKYLFRYKTQVIKKSVKREYIQEFEEIDGILMYQGRIAQENQLKTQDLDVCKFLDFAEIGYPVSCGFGRLPSAVRVYNVDS